MIVVRRRSRPQYYLPRYFCASSALPTTSPSPLHRPLIANAATTQRLTAPFISCCAVTKNARLHQVIIIISCIAVIMCRCYVERSQAALSTQRPAPSFIALRSPSLRQCCFNIEVSFRKAPACSSLRQRCKMGGAFKFLAI